MQAPSWTKQLPLRYAQRAIDIAVLAGAFALAYELRFEFAVPRSYASNALTQLPFVVAVQLLGLWFFGVYRFVWRYVGLRELPAFLLAGSYSAVPLVVARVLLPDGFDAYRIPLSVIVMNGGIAFAGVLGVRILRRVLFERSQRRDRGSDAPGALSKVILVGAGRAGVLAAKELAARPDTALHILGFVDDDPSKHGTLIQGLKVLGATRDLPRLVGDLGADQIIITIANASREALREIVTTAEKAGVRTRIIPPYYEILQGNLEVSRIRDVQIEDLLGRAPVELEHDSLAECLEGKVVLVTGAGGSIGSELCRQALRFAPKRLLLVERSEPSLFHIHRELIALESATTIVPLIADVGDDSRMEGIFREHRPHVVLHAAAHKHVPLMEANPVEALKNNVLGTHTTAELAGKYEADVFVLISTDKAVNPSSVMGASKRVAELVVQQSNRAYATRYVAVRFGNVLGSAGSVIPIFAEQIKKGGPVTVTDPEMVRYFMTIPEASQLVLQAGAIGDGGEIFVLDMGKPVRIVDLANDMIRLSGLRPGVDVTVVFSGMRPGEKLFEELAVDGEGMNKTRHPKIFVGSVARPDSATIESALRSIRTLAASRQRSEQDARRILRELVPEGTVTEAGDVVDSAVRPRKTATAPAPARPSHVA